MVTPRAALVLIIANVHSETIDTIHMDRKPQPEVQCCRVMRV